MTYQVLARKWRPRTFAELVGQDTVVRTLTHAFNHQRLHHAYLFTGTRGVGKTTLGRIIAKCMNCEKGINAIPCGECTACLAIDKGTFVDLIEVDAASRTRVEDTRELLDNAHYAPAQGRFKIYFIDEVHMLSNHSFNALLKILEEPPPHNKFIFATTDPEKLPETVLSRCLQFHLKNIPPPIITAQLEKILKIENIHFEKAALERLAFAAAGSMRDALSLLDQAIAFGQGTLTDQDSKVLLGSIEHDDLLIFIDAISKQDTALLQSALEQIAQHQCDYYHAAETLLSLLHHLALLQLFPHFQTDFFTQQRDTLLTYSKQFTPEEIQLLYQIALLGRRDLPLATTPKKGFEMLIIRLYIFKPTFLEPNLHPAKKIPEKPVTHWETLLPQLALSGLSAQLAQHCVLHKKEENAIELLLSPQHHALLNANTQSRLEKALTDYFGKTIKLNIKIGEKNLETPAEKKKGVEKAKQNALLERVTQDENVQALLSAFNAKIGPESIEEVPHE